MKREELLLVQLAEECCEIGKLVSKSLRFGLDCNRPGKNETNRERLLEEIIDLLAVYNTLVAGGSLAHKHSFQELQLKMLLKRNKVERYLKVSEEKGKLC